MEYLTNDDVDDPEKGMQNEMRIDAARSRFGEKSAKEMSELLERNTAFHLQKSSMRGVRPMVYAPIR